MANSNMVSILPSPEADNASTSHRSSSSSSSSSKAQLLLRPPPAAGSTVHFQSTATNITSDTRSHQKLSQPSASLSTTTIISDSYAVAIEGEEDWSDFTSS